MDLRAVRWQERISELIIIFMLSSRTFTFLFSLLMGKRGVLVFIALILTLLLLALIYDFKTSNKSKTYIFIFFFLVLAILFCLSLALNPGLSKWIFDRKWGFAVQVLNPRGSIFLFLAVLLVEDFDRLFKSIERASLISLFYLLVQVGLFYYLGDWRYYFSAPVASSSVYNMNLGYELIFVALVFLASGLYRQKIAYLLVGSLVGALALYFGSRGILVVLLAFVLIAGLFIRENRKKNLKLLTFCLILIILLVALLNYLPSLVSLDSLVQDPLNQQEQGEDMEKLAPKSRNAEILVEGDFFEDGARMKLWSIALEGVKEKGLLGGGVFADRIYVGRYYEWGYSHNIFLEALTNFGLLGLALVFYLVYLSVKALQGKYPLSAKYGVLVFSSMSTKLLISDSLWFLKDFWGLIGILTLIFVTRELALRENLKRYSLLFGLFIFALSSMVYLEVNRQSFKLISFDRPSVILSFEGSETSSLKTYELIQEKGLLGTSFISAGKLGTDGYLLTEEVEELREMAWDFQDNSFKHSNLNKFFFSNLSHDFDKTEEAFEELKLKKPLAFMSPGGRMSDGLRPVVEYRRKFSYFPQDKDKMTVYKKISLGDTHNLRGFNPFVKSGDLDMLEAIIDRAQGEKALFFLHFSNKEEMLEEFELVLDQLIERNFQFLSFSDLDRMSLMEEGDYTLTNYLSNLGLTKLFN